MTADDHADAIDKAASPRLQFSLRALLAASFAASCWLGILRVAPHVAAFLSGVAMAFIATLLIVRMRHRRLSALSRASLVLFAGFAWLYFYVLSIGPVVAINENVLNLDQSISESMYAPVIWIHNTTPLAVPLERYGALWGWH